MVTFDEEAVAWLSWSSGIDFKRRALGPRSVGQRQTPKMLLPCLGAYCIEKFGINSPPLLGLGIEVG